MEIAAADLDRLNDNILYRTMGIKVLEASAGNARGRLEPKPEVCWPEPDQPHGGVLFTLMDTTMAWAVMSGLGGEKGCATVHLDIQYTRAARGSVFFCTAETTRQGGRLCFSSARIHDDQERLVATGQATWSILNNSPH